MPAVGHPRRDESIDAAALRRLEEELGFETALRFVYSFEYHATFRNAGSEHELCSVFVGRLGSPERLCVNAAEVAGTRWVYPAELDRELEVSASDYAPWLHLEWSRVRDVGSRA